MYCNLYLRIHGPSSNAHISFLSVYLTSPGMVRKWFCRNITLSPLKSPNAPNSPKSAKFTTTMEDLKRESYGEPAKSPPTHEIRPPKRPDKLPLSQPAETPPMDQPERRHSQELSNMQARSPTAPLPGADSADAAISGNTRSDQFWTFPTPQTQHPMWHQPWYPGPMVQDPLWAAHQAYQNALAQRLALSRDDMDLLRPQRSRDRDEERWVRREMESLREQLREANSRADQAERAAEELTRQLKSRSSERMMDRNDSADTTTTLKAENNGLKAELDEARSHIFSLQPYRKDLTPKEVGQVSCFTRQTMAGLGLTQVGFRRSRQRHHRLDHQLLGSDS
jgi:hypothetical protein